MASYTPYNSRVSELSNKVSSGFLSFIAGNSLLETNHASMTRVVFTPIIPYRAIEYDTVSATMINLQDALFQKVFACDPVWSDEGVYRIAKELH